MLQKIIRLLGLALLLSFSNPLLAKKWCCEKDGKVQANPETKKKMCVSGKQAPSEKLKGKKAKLFKSCQDLNGQWTIAKKTRKTNKAKKALPPEK